MYARERASISTGLRKLDLGLQSSSSCCSSMVGQYVCISSMTYLRDFQNSQTYPDFWTKKPLGSSLIFGGEPANSRNLVGKKKST